MKRNLENHSLSVALRALTAGAILVIGCTAEVGPIDSEEDPTDTLSANAIASTVLFNSRFEPSSSGTPSGALQIDDIVGTDNSVPPPNNWSNFSPRLGRDFTGLIYEGASASDAYARIVADPTGAGRGNVLKYWMRNAVSSASHGGTKGRIQARFSGLANDLDSLYLRYLMYIDRDFQRAEALSSPITFLNLGEYWHGGRQNVEHPFRIGFMLNKASGSGSPLYFACEATDAVRRSDGSYTEWTHVWSRQNTTFRVPFNQWATVEVFYTMGNNSTGRFSVYMTPPGGPKVTLCDARTWTYSPDDPSPAFGLRFIEPLKLYTADEVINAIRGPRNDHAAILYFDNLTIREGFPY